MELLYRGTREGLNVIYSITNAIIRGQQYVYAKMRKVIYLEGIPLFLGHLIIITIMPMVVLYLL